MESRLEKIFSMGINSMSLAVWLGEDRKCSAAVVGLDLLLGLSNFLTFRACSVHRFYNLHKVKRYRNFLMDVKSTFLFRLSMSNIKKYDWKFVVKSNELTYIISEVPRGIRNHVLRTRSRERSWRE